MKGILTSRPHSRKQSNLSNVINVIRPWQRHHAWSP